MKIVHIISSPAAGGAEVYVKDLSVELSRRGSEVHIVFLETAAESGRDALYEEQFLRQLDDAYITYSFIGTKSRKKPWVGIVALRSVVAKHRPDVVHCHLYYAAVFSLFVAGVPVVYTHHNIEVGAHAWIYKLLDLRVSAYVGICLACTRMLSGLSSKPVIRIDNAVTAGRLEYTPQEKEVSSAGVRVVCVGRVSPQKNYDLLISACERLQDLNFEVIVAGEGPELDRLRLLVSKGTAKIDFIGNVSDVPSLLASADVFVMSSAYEGLPIALIEASMMGLPAVVTNVGGCAEVIHLLGNGIVVDELTVESFSLALRRMIQDVDMRLGFAENARKYAEHYSIENAAVKHLKLYESVRR